MVSLFSGLFLTNNYHTRIITQVASKYVDSNMNVLLWINLMKRELLLTLKFM